MKLPLIQGAYEARSPIANAQSCINLYPEPNTQDAPFPMTHYPSPGVSIASDYTGVFSGTVRGVYNASDSTFYAVIGQTVIPASVSAASSSGNCDHSAGSIPSPVL